MTKQEVRDLIDGDEKLSFWAGVLFAETCELVHSYKARALTNVELATFTERKVKEFEEIVLYRMKDICKDNINEVPSLKDKVSKLEQKIMFIESHLGI